MLSLMLSILPYLIRSHLKIRKISLMEKPVISITPEESQLFDILLNSVRWKAKNTVLRVAGGWVRDKVINLCFY